MIDPRGRDRAVYIISVAAESVKIHPQTLRIYDRRGLVQPARTGGGSRRYSDADIDKLRRVHELTSEGMNLDGVERVMALEDEVARLKAQVQRLTRELESKRADIVLYRRG